MIGVRSCGIGALKNPKLSAAGFLQLKRRFVGLGLTELRELRQLREENRKLKTLVADLTLDKHIVREVLSKKA